MAKQSGKSTNKLRIIGGQWRSRQLPFPDVQGLRPTTDRVRETVFNWLMPYLPGAKVLDVFAGSGALGFEALSREAADAVLLEKDSKAARMLKENTALLKANAQVFQTDSLNWLQSCDTQFNVIFLDPPFNKGLLPNCIETIESKNLLAANGWIYIESEADLSELNIPSSWHMHRDKKAGQVMLRLFQKVSDA